MENKPSENFSNIFTIKPTKLFGYLDNDTVKRTILAQEATFREQVSELHRLYNVQKNLMELECQRGALSERSQEKMYSSPSRGIRIDRKVEPPTGHDMKKPSEKIMKGKYIECSSNGVSMRHSNSRSTQEKLAFQVPNDAHADASDDDVVILSEKPANSSARNKGSTLGTNVHKMEDFQSVDASSSQKQCYSSPGVNMNLPSLEDTLKGKRLGVAIGSNFFVANDERRHNNPYIHSKYDRSNGMECFTHEKNGVDSSTAHDHSSYNIHNPQTFAASSSNAAFKSSWQSNTKGYTTRMYYGDTEVPNGQNGCLPTLQAYCRLPTSKITQLGGIQYQKQSQFYNCPKDVNLSNGPEDATATLEKTRHDTPMEISWVKKKLLNMRKEIYRKKSQVPSNYAAGHPHILVGSMVHSEGNTRILGFPINATNNKDSQLSCTMHMGTDCTPSSKGVHDMEIQFQNKDDTNARYLIDLNVALPFIDEMEIDGRPSEGDIVPQEQDDSSNEALVVSAAKNLMAMHKDKFQVGSPEGNNNDFEALKMQLFKTKDHVCNSTLLTQENKRSEDHDIAIASASNVLGKSN